MTPNRRRAAVAMAVSRFGVSQRRACRIVGQPRSTQRLPKPVPSDAEQRLREWLRTFAVERPRWGWRRAAKTLRREGQHVSDSRIKRLWRDEGLRVPARKRKKRLSGVGAGVGSFCPIAPDVVWAADFQFDRTANGCRIKLLNIVDEYTREALATVAAASITADDVTTVLDRIVVERGGSPDFVRFDNGPEFVAQAVADWCRFTSIDSVFIDPGSPWQNAWIESFNGRLRDELLNGWQFDSIFEAQVIIDDWRHDYNTNRPHTAHGDLTPAEFRIHYQHQTNQLLPN